MQEYEIYCQSLEDAKVIATRLLLATGSMYVRISSNFITVLTKNSMTRLWEDVKFLGMQEKLDYTPSIKLISE